LELQELNRIRRQTSDGPEEEKPEEEEISEKEADEIDQAEKEVIADPKPVDDDETEPEIKPSNRDEKQIPSIDDDEEVAQVDEIEPETRCQLHHPFMSSFCASKFMLILLNYA